MYEGCYEHIPSVEGYLARIGIDGTGQPSAALLDKLIYAHQCAVPFENLEEYHNPKELSLAIGELYEKIVENRRGGFCFELNALFCALLRELGFEVDACMARVTMDEGEHIPLMHRISVVTVDEQAYLVDVGFGGPMPGFAVPLIDGTHPSGHGQTFSLRKLDEAWWDLAYESSKGSQPLLRFTTTASEECDFIALAYYCSGYPESEFVTTPLVNIRTPQGSREIMGAVYTEHSGGLVAHEEIADDTHLMLLLREKFGIRA